MVYNTSFVWLTLNLISVFDLLHALSPELRKINHWWFIDCQSAWLPSKLFTVYSYDVQQLLRGFNQSKIIVNTSHQGYTGAYIIENPEGLIIPKRSIPCPGENVVKHINHLFYHQMLLITIVVHNKTGALYSVMWR